MLIRMLKEGSRLILKDLLTGERIAEIVVARAVKGRVRLALEALDSIHYEYQDPEPCPA